MMAARTQRLVSKCFWLKFLTSFGTIQNRQRHVVFSDYYLSLLEKNCSIIIHMSVGINDLKKLYFLIFIIYTFGHAYNIEQFFSANSEKGIIDITIPIFIYSTPYRHFETRKQKGTGMYVIRYAYGVRKKLFCAVFVSKKICDSAWNLTLHLLALTKNCSKAARKCWGATWSIHSLLSSHPRPF